MKSLQQLINDLIEAKALTVEQLTGAYRLRDKISEEIRAEIERLEAEVKKHSDRVGGNGHSINPFANCFHCEINGKIASLKEQIGETIFKEVKS